MREEIRSKWVRLVARARLAQGPDGPVPLSDEMQRNLAENNPKYSGELKHYMFCDEDRAEYETVVHEGLLCSRDPRTGELCPHHDKVIFVLAPEGKLYVRREVYYRRSDDFTHAGFLGARAVMTAGEMYIQQGRLLLVNNLSGHYLPPATSLIDILRWLREKLAPLDGTLVCGWSAGYKVKVYSAPQYLAEEENAHALPEQDYHKLETNFFKDLDRKYGFLQLLKGPVEKLEMLSTTFQEADDLIPATMDLLEKYAEYKHLPEYRYAIQLLDDHVSSLEMLAAV
jgi:hypothetical protein